MWPNLLEIADLVTFTEVILNGKLIFCAVIMTQEKYLLSVLVLLGVMALLSNEKSYQLFILEFTSKITFFSVEI